MELNEWGLIWYLFSGFLMLVGSAILIFIAVSFFLKMFYKPQSNFEDEVEI